MPDLEDRPQILIHVMEAEKSFGSQEALLLVEKAPNFKSDLENTLLGAKNSIHARFFGRRIFSHEENGRQFFGFIYL